ncbi:MAG: LamG domain-containing protein, partial [Spirochaetia bacterium]|nr:LamG domain-containing protein [Spirochaetia bacterium]
VATAYRALAGYGDTSIAGGAVGISVRANNEIMVISGNSYTSAGGNTLPINTWTHFCITHDGGTGSRRVFVNGGLAGSASSAGYSALAATDIFVAAKITGADTFTGRIDDVRIYDAVLSEMQIRNLATQIPTGLVARFDFQGDARDVSGNGYTATVNGATLAPDRIGYISSAYSFSNTNIDTNVDVDNDVLTAGTVSAWYYMSAVSGNNECIFSNDDGEWDRVASITPGGATLSIGDNNNLTAAFVPAQTNPYRVWQHILITYNSGGTNTVYLNGRSLGTFTSDGTIGQSASFLRIGQNPAGAACSFYGRIDDVRVYNRVLSEAEIRILSGYHPMQVSGWNIDPALSFLKLHMDAGRAQYAGTGTCNGGVNCVSSWPDISNYAASLTQATGANQPVYNGTGLNGRPSIDFSYANGTNILSATNPISPTGRFTIFFAMNRNASAGAVIENIFDTVSASWGHSFHFTTGDFFRSEITSIFGRPLSTTAFTPPLSPFIISRKHDETSNAGLVDTYLNGALDSTGTVGSWNTGFSGSGLRLGHPTTSASMSLGELILMDTSPSGADITAADRELVECYLSAKYNIPINHACP